MFPLAKYTDMNSNPEKYAQIRYKQFIDNFNKCVKGEFRILPNQTYVNGRDHLQLEHICGRVCSITVTNLLNMANETIKTGCRPCRYKAAADKQRDTIETFKDKLYTKGYPVGEFKFLNEYVDTNTKLKLLHIPCGRTLEMRPREMIQGNQCARCSLGNISKPEQELLDFIRKLLPNEKIIGNYKIPSMKNPKSGHHKELDIFLPERNIGFEYNGTWWHKGERGLDDYQKILDCSDIGITVYTVREHEWFKKKDIVKDRIQTILGATEDFTKLYARKLIVKEVPIKEKSAFLSANHIQGNDSTFLRLGLYDINDVLCSVMTFSKPRRSMNGSNIELSRFCVLQKHLVVGGFSKLFKAALKILGEGTTITTYAMMSYSRGNVYEVNGFEPTHYTKPGVWYWHRNTNKILHRFNLTKKSIIEKYNNGDFKFYDENLSDTENLEKNNWFKFYDSGNIVFKYN
jgi:hypothetical protein